MSETTKAPQLSAAYVKALTAAKVAIRSPSEENWVEAQIVDLYDLGKDKNTKEPVQPLEIITPDSSDVKNYIIKGKEAIQLILGSEKNGMLSKITYANGRPISLRIPLLKPNNDGQYWFSVKKA